MKISIECPDIEQNGEIYNLAKNTNVWRAKKPTTGVPTKMFDPSKERSWSEFFDDMTVFKKNVF